MKHCCSLLFKMAILITLCLMKTDDINAQYIQHNWPVNQLNYNNFQWGGRVQYLATKIKYSPRDFRITLFNSIDNSNSLPIEAEGVPTSAYHSGSFSSKSISLLRTNTTGVYNWLQISGSATCYAKDFETDSSENFFILADNNGNTWDSAFHFPLLSNYADSTQLLIFKTDSAGKVKWFKLYGGSNSEYAKCIKRTKDGNLLVLASTQSNDGNVLNFQGGTDIWLFKINAVDGSIIWQKTYGSALNEIPYDMEVLADESIVIAGTADASSFLSSSYSGKNAFLMKVDKLGTVTWKKTFGGNGDDLVRNFIPVNDGGFACVGTTNSASGDIPGNAGGTDVFASKLKADGSLQWIKTYGNTDNDRAGDIVYSTCDSSIYLSYAKQFNNNFNYTSYPGFIQSTGVEVGLYNNGTQFHYHENNFAFPASTSLYNEGFTISMASNTRGGFLGASITHNNWQSFQVGGGYLYTRSFDFIEYGVTLNHNRFDTTVCRGASAWGHIFFNDTTYADSLRNACGIDTLINNYTVHITTNGSQCPIPVTIALFTATVNNKQVNLNWQTATEIGITTYIIQRSQNPGTGFTDIGSVNALNGFAAHSYSFTDLSATAGIKYYYRLLVKENTGSVKYSPVRTAQINSEGFYVTVFPNPVIEKAMLQINNYKGNAQITLVNNTGQILQTKNCSIINSNIINIDMSNEGKGSYYIIIQTGADKIVKRITKL